jgi:uncharacterized protein YdhG (YjbR/CyaY superfamily)
METAAKNIDEYISRQPEDIQVVLKKIRQTITDAAPGAREAIAYGMPTFRLNGNLVHFAAQTRHIGFYPTPSGVSAFEKDLAPYKTTKGAVQFPLDKPIPYKVIEKITKFRAKEALSKK